ncbi:hypothetical protein [Pedobacter nutrimenti]|uniref:hypothetical protein n=1 Tax=Pedobacter nutrimenti TaxID=1241337 RepID=UPI00292D924F|nr:hypothetical protein [Pedobacter nutrimenti]
MKKIKFTGWKKGMNKIKFIQLLHHKAGISLKEAKQIKDEIVDGKTIVISAKAEMVDYLISQAEVYGVYAEVIDNPDPETPQ